MGVVWGAPPKTGTVYSGIPQTPNQRLFARNDQIQIVFAWRYKRDPEGLLGGRYIYLFLNLDPVPG